MTQGFETLDQVSRDLCFASTFEIISSELLIDDVVFQNVIRGREHGGGDGKNRLLRSSSTLEPEKLGAKIGVLGSCRHQEAWTSAVLSHGAPGRVRVEPRL